MDINTTEEKRNANIIKKFNKNLEKRPIYLYLCSEVLG